MAHLEYDDDDGVRGPSIERNEQVHTHVHGKAWYQQRNAHEWGPLCQVCRNELRCTLSEVKVPAKAASAVLWARVISVHAYSF